MSQLASAAARGGKDNAGNKKGKGEVVNSWPSSDSETEHEKKTSRRHSSPIDSMASLEAALPIKRGLSMNYDGKSKSFGNLTDLEFEDAKGMVKKEHAINKSRRLIIANEDYIRENKSSSMPFSPL